jgi:hypothetical protein
LVEKIQAPKNNSTISSNDDNIIPLTIMILKAPFILNLVFYIDAQY